MSDAGTRCFTLAVPRPRIGGAARSLLQHAQRHLRDREVGRAREPVELVPVHGDGDGRPFPGARGEGAHRVRAPDVAQVVHEDLPLPLRLGHVRGEGLGLVAGEPLRHRPSELLELLPPALRLQGHAHVQALAPRRLHEALEAPLAEQRPHAPGRRGDAGEGQRLVGVEVEDHLVRLLEPRHPRVPGMDLEDPGLRERHEAGHRVHEEVLLGLSRDREAPHLGRRPEAGLLLVERLAADSVGAAHEGERAALEIRQHDVGDRDVVEREVQLGEAEVGVVDAVGVGQAHAEEVDDLVAAHGARARRVAAQRFPRPAGRHRVDAAALDRSRPLAHDVARVPVVAKPEEHRLAHPALVRPLRELDLGHEVRLDPVGAALHLGGDGGERARVPPTGLQAALQVGEQALAEAGADLARVHELARLRGSPTWSAPIEARPSDGSVQPPITISWLSRHFAFRQSPPRPSR